MSAALPILPAMAEPTDAQLVERVLGGDHRAYAMLVHRHQHALYRHARGMGLDHDTSLDLVQEAFVKAYDHLEDCRHGAHVRSWLFRICRNLCLDELRSARRRSVPMSTMDDVETIEDPRALPDELTFTLRRALDRLPTALREAFLLKHDAGYTYEEIARLTDASPSAVKMRVHRAREALRSYLRSQGLGVGEDVEAEGDNRARPNRLSDNNRNDWPATAAAVKRAPVTHTGRIP